MGLLLGPLLIGAGLLLNRNTVGAALAPLEYIYNPLYVKILLVCRVTAVCAGALLLFPPLRRRVPWIVRLTTVIAASIALLLGVYGAARWMEWIRLEPRPLGELCAWVETGDDRFLGDGLLRTLEAKRQARHSDDLVDLDLDVRTAMARLQHGRTTEAIELLEQTLGHATSTDPSPPELDRIRRALGMAHLRRGEVNHCIEKHRPESCLFPIRGEGHWVDTEPAQAASAHFEQILENTPTDLGARWLLNLAHMVGGTHPSSVPVDHVIQARPSSSADELLPFSNVAPALGVATFGLLGGAILDDFDNDGFLDLVTSSYHPCDPIRYFHNSGDGTFSDRTEESGLGHQSGGFNLVQTDFDNDGRLDVYVIRGAWMRSYGRQRNSLLQQNPDTTFTDVTEQSGLADSAYPNASAAWADSDNDGDLDLFVGNEDVAPGKTIRSQLFRNNGDGTFTDVTAGSGIRVRGDVKSVAWGDFDNDRDMDLFVSKLSGPNHLYRNLGDGKFADVADALGVARHPPHDRTFASWFWDYDNDGWLDLFVAGYGADSLDLVVADYLGQQAGTERLALYHNDSKGGFVDVTRDAGLHQVHLPMGANYGDIDNDGYPDIYLGTGRPGFEYLIPNVLFHNVDGKRFEDVTTAARVGHLQKGHGIAFGDFDNDGDQDIYTQTGGFYRADKFANALFENPGSGRHWISVKLVGTQTNRAAIGAQIRLLIGEPQGTRAVYGRVGSGGSFGASTLRMELGIGSAERIEQLEVWWPTSGQRQVFRDVQMDQFLEITEGVDLLKQI